MAQYIQVSTTAEKKEDVQRIARAVVEEKLAVCVQIVGPIHSVYWWEGKIEEAGEWLCIIKTKKDLYNELEKTVLQLHPYDTPEIMAIPVVQASKDYVEWIEKNIKS